MTLRFLARPLRTAAALVVLAAGASAYYHFVRFTTSGSPYIPVYDRFNLDALRGSTVQFFVSNQGPASMAPGDSMNAILSEIRAAAKVWNDVNTSALRLAYGGTATSDTLQSTPGIDVIFTDDIPPGLIALGGPTSRNDMMASANGSSIVPIQRSVLMMRSDLSHRPSWSERFFMTLVHEFGHTLGLQHTLTSSTMSTEITRATSKASPLGADDIAGISILYPTKSFLANMGTVTGRITMGGEAVNLASVVALTASGPAISTLTNPDGAFRLAGLPPGTYSLYVHTLPQALASENTPANIIPPLDASGNRIPSGPAFFTRFYDGGPLGVAAGKTISDVNMDVQARQDSHQISSVQSYSFFGSNAVKPGYFNRHNGSGSLISAGYNLTANSAPTPGLNVSVLGGADVVTNVAPYVSDPVNWIQTDVAIGGSAPDGQRHMLFSTPSDLYVLPSAYRVVSAPPPAITGVSPAPDGTGIAVTGTTIGSYTRILFDGVPATVLRADDGIVVVNSPSAPGGYRAAIVALNPDGQSSLFLQGDTTSNYSYDPQPDIASISLSPTALPAGVDTFIEINAPNGNFVQGDTQVGFGSSDILVRKVWVFGPARLLVEVSAAPGAQSATTTVTITTGLQYYVQTYTFSLQALNPSRMSLSLPAPSGSATIFPGSFVSFTAYNLPSQATSPTVFFGGAPVPSRLGDNNQITFQVPPNFGIGLAVLAVQAGSDFSLPTLVLVGPAPPVVASVFANSSTAVSALNPAHPGDTLSIAVYSLAIPGAVVDKSRVRVLVGDADQAIAAITPLTGSSGGHIVTCALSQSVATDQPQPLRVMIDSLSSSAFYIAIQPAN